MWNKTLFESIDITGPAPESEPARQYYYMKKCREWADAEKETLGRPLTYFAETLGCQMNAKDSEKMTAILEYIGYVPGGVLEKKDGKGIDADFVLYNTCTVRENANQKIYGHLGFLKNQKEQHPTMKIALCGCMMQEEDEIEKVRKSYPFVDLVFGTFNIYKLAELLYEQITTQKRVMDVWNEPREIVEDLPGKRKYDFKTGVNIMYGCNNFCSYCIVPYVRGRERSRHPEEILEEIRGLVAEGVTEVMLLGQNVNSYGKTYVDAGAQPGMQGAAGEDAQPAAGAQAAVIRAVDAQDMTTFAQLLRQVNEIEGLRRIRFMTSHPKDLSDELIEAMATCDKVCDHLHLPLQSGSSRILRKMNRSYDKELYLSLVDRIRTRMPEIALTTDIIVGFPGETEEDFLDTLDVVDRVGYDSAYTFIYSKRTGTPAARMPEEVPADVIKDRFDRLLDLVHRKSEALFAARLGRTYEALVEEVNDHDPSMVSARLSNNALVHLVAPATYVGHYVNVRLVENKGFYYIGETAN
ncbi:MAG: radical SAM protein [Eubacterium sp.]|nr:radical SAM protein [Eubacterium sp.]